MINYRLSDCDRCLTAHSKATKTLYWDKLPTRLRHCDFERLLHTNYISTHSCSISCSVYGVLVTGTLPVEAEESEVCPNSKMTQAHLLSIISDA